ncbi:UNVERIFIED_CONTAM: hypothetical protein Sradi_4066100 [Sesamum radiatum]|uniref:Uncharacterized protein n=1 Tax=Sesamum radiatum TaxID=300843 RepID=A0AAW2PIW2_SESRA
MVYRSPVGRRPPRGGAVVWRLSQRISRSGGSWDHRPTRGGHSNGDGQGGSFNNL